MGLRFKLSAGVVGEVDLFMIKKIVDLFMIRKISRLLYDKRISRFIYNKKRTKNVRSHCRLFMFPFKKRIFRNGDPKIVWQNIAGGKC